MPTSVRVNTNSIVGMDLRDVNLNQAAAKEIINLTKGTSGWKVRDSKKDIFTVPTTGSEVKSIFRNNNQLVMQIGNVIRIYALSDVVVGDMLASYELDFEFKMFQTNFPSVFFVIDTDHGRNYVCEFTDRIMALCDDTGSPDVSTEFLLNEFDVNTKDTTWAGMARHDDCEEASAVNEGSAEWDESINRYLMQWGAGTGYKKVVLLQQYNYINGEKRYIVIAGLDSDTYAYLYDWGEDSPERWTKRIKLTGTNIFTDGTRRFMSVTNTGTNIEWSSFGNNLTETVYAMIVFDGDLFVGTYNGVFKLDTVTRDWNDVSTGISGQVTGSINSYQVNYFIEIDDVLYIAAQGGVHYWTPSSNSWTKIGLTYEPQQLTIFDGDIWAIWQYADDGSGGVSSWNGTSWDDKSTGLSGLAYTSVLAFDSGLYCCTNVSIYKWNAGTDEWDAFDTGMTDTGKYLYEFDSELYCGTSTGGVFKLSGSTWSAYNTGLSGTELQTKGFYETDSGALIVCTAAGPRKLVSGTWIDYGDTVLNAVVEFDSALYGGATGVYSYGAIIADDTNIYVPNAGNIGKLNINSDEDTLTWTADEFTFPTAAKSCEVLDFNFQYDSVTYLLTLDDVAAGEILKLYVINKSGEEVDSIESTAIDAAVTAANAILDDYVFTDFRGMHAIRNEAISNADSTKRAFTIIIFYSNQFRLIDLWADSGAVNTTLQVDIHDIGQILPSDYRITSQTFVTGTKEAAIADNDYTHYVYAIDDSRLIKFPITGQAMTAADIAKIETIYNFEISPYNDVEGAILGAWVSNPRGYKLTEINRSPKLPVRPYFTADLLDSLYHFSGAQVIAGTVTTPPTTKLTVTNAYAFKVGDSVEDTTSHTETVISIDSATELTMSGTTLAGTAFTVTPAATIETEYELFNIFARKNTSDAYYRTPIEIGGGSQVLTSADDDNYSHDYWIYALLKPGLYDSNIPFTNIGRGVGDAQSYSYKYWKTKNYYTDTVLDSLSDAEIEASPKEFNATESNTYQPAVGRSTINAVLNNKVFFVSNDDDRDCFGDTGDYYEQFGSVAVEIQDLISRADNMLLALCYDKKQIYYSYGYKFLNTLNYNNFNSRPTSIHPMTSAGSIILCENDIYLFDGQNEAAMIAQHYTANIGIEKDNYEAVVTDGQNVVFQNEKGIYLVNDSGIQQIHLPIEDYIYKQTSGNKIGIDSANGEVYIPLDASKMTDLKTVLKDGDYGTSGNTTHNWSWAYGVYNIKSNSWRIYAYERDDSTTREQFFGNLRDFLVTRVEDKLIIPEYKISQGTENPLCRFELRRMSFGSFHDLQMLRKCRSYFINEGDYGVDYMKSCYTINDTTKVVFKYGNFNGTAYSDVPTGYGGAYNIAYDATLRPQGIDSDRGIIDVNVNAAIDFRSIRICNEFQRVRDTNYANISLIEITPEYVDKKRNTNGISS